MEGVLAGLIGEKCIIYLDDVLVIGRTFEEHRSNLREVFTRLTKAGLKLKPSKCKLVRKEVKFLGYVISRNGISPDPKKLAAMEEFPKPKDLRALRAYLGLTSYYRRFVPSFSALAQPLYKLTKKDVPFVWTDACEEAFQQLKQLLMRAPVLAYPNFSRDFLLETDASGLGLGAVLSQSQDDESIRPIAFASRTLQAHEKTYGISELEALGVVWAVRHFRHYIYGHRCTIYMDHEALKSLLNTPHPSGKLAQWGMALQELDLKIEYRPWRANGRADALSRYPIAMQPGEPTQSGTPTVVGSIQAAVTGAQSGEETLEAQSGEEATEVHECLPQRQFRDPHLRRIIEYLQSGVLPEDDVEARHLTMSEGQFLLLERVLYHLDQDKTLKLIPPTEDRERLFREVHQGPFSGHLREAKVHSQLSRHYWWPPMRKDIAHWCRACLTCATRSPG